MKTNSQKKKKYKTSVKLHTKNSNSNFCYSFTRQIANTFRVYNLYNSTR